MLSLFVVALVVTLSVLANAETHIDGSFFSNAAAHFETFKAKFHKQYETTEEHDRRRGIFFESMKRVDEKNKRNGSPSFGVTKFSDMTLEEFSVLLGRKNNGHQPSRERKVRDPKTTKLAVNEVASTVDGAVNWQMYGKVTPVKDQGQCGSCWAFSTAEAVESASAMSGNPLWEFSVQQVASCVDACNGCGGGDTVAAYDYFSNNTQALASSWYAPYKQSMYKQCLTKKCTETCDSINQADVVKYSSLAGPVAQIIDYEYATPPCYGPCKNQDTQTLAENVAAHGPASICVNAANWNDYTGGVLTADACGGSGYFDVDHCVQLVGFNATASTPYWIVRNSWATNWGIDGYIHLEYPGNTCALSDEATFVTLK